MLSWQIAIFLKRFDIENLCDVTDIKQDATLCCVKYSGKTSKDILRAVRIYFKPLLNMSAGCVASTEENFIIFRIQNVSRQQLHE